MKSERKTSEQWAVEFAPRLVVLDPDGWDRINFQYSWYEEMISREEFEKRVGMSTCFAQVQ